MDKQRRTKKPFMLTVVQTLMVPVLVLLFFEILDYAVAGQHVIGSIADIKTLLRNLITAFAFSLAISANLFSGRMDLSLGAQMYAGVILGGNLALAMGWGGIGVLICSMVAAGLCGLLIGTMFVNMRILPMVLGLGMTLVFECICYSVNDQQGVLLFGKPGTDILSNVGFVIAIALALLFVTMYLFQYSTYGYKLRAIQGSQKLAGDAGVNIFTNCVQCYILAGVLAGIAGVFNAAYSGSLTPVMGMSSNGTVFSNMFPMMLGMWIGSFSHNQQLGMLMGSLSVRILILGMSKLSMGNSMQNIILYTLFLLFSIYNANRARLGNRKAWNDRYALAQKTKAELAQKALA